LARREEGGRGFDRADGDGEREWVALEEDDEDEAEEVEEEGSGGC
jgi:hypothetical protein